MDYIVQIKSEREKLLSPVYNTEQISMTQVKIPLVQPLINDVSRIFCYETRDTAANLTLDGEGNIVDTEEFALESEGHYALSHPGDNNTTIYRKYSIIISTTEPNPTTQQLAQGFQGSDLSAHVDDKYVDLGHSLPWKMLYNNAIFGKDEQFSQSKRFCPNLGPPIIYATMGDPEEIWRSKVGDQTALMTDCECGEYFVDSVGDHQRFEWIYQGKTVGEIWTKFEWEHNGQMHPYDFMGREWVIKLTIRGEIDGLKIQRVEGPERDTEVPSIGANISFVKETLFPKRMKEVWLIIITIVFIFVLMSMNK